MRVVLIVNPFASRVTEEDVRAVERELARVGEVQTSLTEWRGHATELAREAVAAGAEAIVAFSGDGGYNEVLNGVDGAPLLGFVPGGHTNVLPRALGLPREAVPAAAQIAEALAEGRSRRISLGRVNGRRFAFNAGVGFDAELVRRVDALGRRHDGRRPGDVAFAWTIVRLLARRRGRFAPALEIEGLGRAAFALVANCDPYSYAGGMPLHVAPEASFEGGLDLVAPRDARARAWPRYVRYISRGRGQEGAPDIAYGHDLDRISIRCDAPLPLQADGEDLGDVTEIELVAERDAVAVLV
jgi:diacylglycerol kinase family enzyme